MGKDIKEFFLNPTHITHRKYEVLRALCIDKIKAKDVAERFGYSLFSINAMKRDFVNAVKSNQIDSSHFFLTRFPGRNPDATKADMKERIIQLRKQN